MIRTAILGASGYTGADVIRLLLRHPHVKLSALSAQRQAGQRMDQIFPHFAACDLPVLLTPEEINWSEIDLVFSCLPHGTSQDILAHLPDRLRIIDLSADFRLKDAQLYETWYKRPHDASALLQQAVYGLPEWYREDIRKARLIANPGCYPTASLLALLPGLTEGMIARTPLIIDAKSGVSGAGRSLKQNNLFCEISESMKPYGIGNHRHLPEIEQELSHFCKQRIEISFTPHLIPMNRGELVTCYAQLAPNCRIEDLRGCYEKAYQREPFVKLLPPDIGPSTGAVRGSNLCLINIFADHRQDAVIIIAAIDNLVRGSAGQAIHNMNLLYGWPETTALEQIALYP